MIQKRPVFPGRIELHKMETADEDVRPEVFCDGYDAFVGTAADENAFSLLFYQQEVEKCIYHNVDSDRIYKIKLAPS